jgi:nitrile hydratase beta subunit
MVAWPPLRDDCRAPLCLEMAVYDWKQRLLTLIWSRCRLLVWNHEFATDPGDAKSSRPEGAEHARDYRVVEIKRLRRYFECQRGAAIAPTEITMNGIHDLGGFTCFGAVVREENEPVFHANWERRVFAMMNLGGVVLGPVDALRHAIERMQPLHYLETTYYEHWLAALETRIEDRQLRSADKSAQTIDASIVDAVVAGGVPASRDVAGVLPRFAVGDEVIARNMNPAGHTRLPRYVRGHRGTVVRLHGNHVFPDTLAHDAGEDAHPLYSVCFGAAELWGEAAPARDSLYIDLWERYLEAVPA